jgi:hydrogenase/urease accessory protein HupE
VTRGVRLRPATWLVAGTFVLGAPSVAHAHLVTTGLGPVYDGIGHLLLSPDDLVPAIALGLYAGLRGPEAGRRAMFLAPLAWLAGGLAGTFAGEGTGAFPVAALSFVVLGVLVAADLRTPPVAVAALAVALGLAYGFANGVVLRDGAGVAGLVGIAGILFVVVTLAAALVVALRAPPARIAVRVAGSWVAAVGLLLFGWAMR